MIDLSKLTIESASRHLKNGDFSVSELVDKYLEKIEEKNPSINAYLEIFSDIREKAKEAEEIIKNGKGEVLTGIPLAIKDNILIEGKNVSAASKILGGYVAPYDSTVIKKLKSQNTLFLGRTNMDEFAMGGSTENSSFGPTKNPNDEERVPGGSSGGSAASVSANMSLGALGSDTGGSIRQPASFCGCVGLKPTYGRVSRFGLIAMGSSLDQIGPITKTVEDSRIIFNAIKGKDSLDGTTCEVKEESQINKKITIGLPKGLLGMEGIDDEVSSNFEESLGKIKDLGFEIKEIDLPNILYSLATYYIIMPAEVSSNLARFDGVKYGSLKEGDDLLGDYLKTRGELFGKETRRRIVLGTYVLSSGYYDAYYNKANIVKGIILEDFKRAFNNVDTVVMPTSPVLPFKIGEKINNPLSMYLSDIFTVPANIAGIPAISIPSGFIEKNGKKLPMGIQFMSNYFNEEKLFFISKKFLGE